MYTPDIYREECSTHPQPQQRLHPHLKDIVKEELQKLLDVNFIYSIAESKLVVVPKKNGKWRIFVDYQELNKAT